MSGQYVGATSGGVGTPLRTPMSDSLTVILTVIMPVLNTLILAITAVIVWWYTWETRRLRETAQRQVEVAYQQIEVQQRPLVIIKAQQPGPLTVLNIGNSAAINIKIGVANGPSTVMIPLLTPGSGSSIGVDTNDGTPDTRSRLGFYTDLGFGEVNALFIDQDSIRNGYTLHIEYQNVAMHAYVTDESITPEGFEIIHSGRHV